MLYPTQFAVFNEAPVWKRFKFELHAPAKQYWMAPA